MTVGDMIIKHLSQGKTQSEISNIFKSEGIEPNSLSSIEKMLKSIRAKHDAKTMFPFRIYFSGKVIYISIILCINGFWPECISSKKIIILILKRYCS